MASGAWESIVINGRRFACKNDDSVTYKLDGFENEMIVGGDGSQYQKKTRHVGAISGLTLICNLENGDPEFLNDCQKSLDFFPVSGTMIDGTVLGGEMQFTDQLEFDSSENTCGVSLEGHLEKQD